MLVPVQYKRHVNQFESDSSFRACVLIFVNIWIAGSIKLKQNPNNYNDISLTKVFPVIIFSSQ